MAYALGYYLFILDIKWKMPFSIKQLQKMPNVNNIGVYFWCLYFYLILNRSVDNNITERIEPIRVLFLKNALTWKNTLKILKKFKKG